MKRTIEFSTLEELKFKIKLLEEVYQYYKKEISETFEKHGVPFQTFGDFGVIVDMENISNKKLTAEQFNSNQFDIVKAVHKLLKVTVIENDKGEA
jgi:hypothetical protein